MVDVTAIVDAAAARMGKGESGIACLVDAVTRHGLADYEILELIARAAEIANRRQAGAM